jgi:hypothetical protein
VGRVAYQGMTVILRFPCHSLDRLESYVIVVNDGGQCPSSRLRRRLAASSPGCEIMSRSDALVHVWSAHIRGLPDERRSVRLGFRVVRAKQ